MRRQSLFLAVFVVLGLSPSVAGSGSPGHPALDPGKIGQAAGVTASAGEDGVVRISWARDDVAVTVDGLSIHPFAGLGSWAAFRPAPGGALMMGDEVVFEDEISPAMDAAFAAGLEVTALHNHFVHDTPKVYFMHVGGRGNPEKLAAGVKSVWNAIRKVRSETRQPATGFPGKKPVPGQISAKPLEKILGHEGREQGGVVKIAIGREGRMHGLEVGGSMGLASWAAFSGSDDLAAVDGDIIMTGAEVQPVLKALRKGGIHVVALHNHMIGEEPAYYFTHFWGKGAPVDLARAIRAALDEQSKVGAGASGR